MAIPNDIGKEITFVFVGAEDYVAAAGVSQFLLNLRAVF